jgi:hypothetical protein
MLRIATQIVLLDRRLVHLHKQAASQIRKAQSPFNWAGSDSKWQEPWHEQQIVALVMPK